MELDRLLRWVLGNKLIEDVLHGQDHEAQCDQFLLELIKLHYGFFAELGAENLLLKQIQFGPETHR